ncbi:MAG: ADP,ATP carrier protein 1 [Chlamydiia bacterium]|nr:ADP,ATP carrier protein 1 [Chlamydiia bacterium]
MRKQGNMTSSAEMGFGKWRKRLWPIHSFELKKLLPLLLIKFLISVNYGILTVLKDTLVVTSRGSGAEVIPVLKGWVVLPVAILAALGYSKLSNVLSKRRLLFTVHAIFLSIIFIYGFILLPYSDFFSPHHTSDLLTQKFNGRFTHWIALYRNWTHALLFVTAELWGSMVILLMFWGYANDISSVNEAKRSYNIYIAAGDVAAILVGPLVAYMARMTLHLPYTSTVQYLIILVLFIGGIVMTAYWWMNKYVLTDKRYFNPQIATTPKKEKVKMSLREGFLQVIKSRYLLGIAIMVVAYGLCISLVEVSWKATLKQQFPQPADYQAFTSKVTSLVGVVALITSLFLGGGIIRYFGWHLSAQLTPIIVGLSGATFFLMLLNKSFLAQLSPILGITPLTLLVMFGAVQNILSKAAKYSFFDPTKEMSFIPLDQEAKVKGKAAIDVVGTRLGKSGSAWIQIGLIDMLGASSVLSIPHLLLPIVTIATISWILSVKSLSKRFDAKQQEQLTAAQSTT